MTRMFETSEITKLLDVLIGKTEAVGETNEDERRLDNLKTLIDVTNWCLDGLQFAMASGYGRAEYSMVEISYTAQCALDEYGRWISDVLEEQIAEQTEPQSDDEFKLFDREALILLIECQKERIAELLAKTEPNSSEIPNNCEPQICDFCRYYNSNIPCGTTPSACKEADKFAEEFVDGLKKLKSKDEPQYEMGMGTLQCDNCSEYGSFKCTKCDGEMYFTRLEPKDEPQTSGVVWTEDAIKKEPKSYTTWASTDEPQTDVWEYHNGEWTEPQTEQGKCPFDDEIPCEWVNCPNSKTDCAWK